MNLQSQQTCPNPSVCVIFSCQGADVLDRLDVYQHTHTQTHLLAEHLCTTFACGRDLKHRRGESLSQDFVSGKNRAAIWFCLAQTDCNLTLICSCAALSPQKREREKNRHKRKRGKWPLYLSPDQNKNRWTTFPDALDSTGFRYSICRPAVCAGDSKL